MGRSKPRHALPRGRAGLEAANAALQKDLSDLRWSRWGDQMEMVRLQALVEGLSHHVGLLAGELAGVRQELVLARTTPPVRDPFLDQLMAEAASLRATVATQEAMLAELSARFRALHAEVEEGRLAAAVPVVTPHEEAAPLEPPVVVPEPQPVVVDLAPVPDVAPHPELEPVFAAVGALQAPGPSAASPARTRPVATIADSAIDDETVRRLRLIREGYGA